MCILMDSQEEEHSNSGSPRLQLKQSRTWLISRRTLQIILAFAIIFFIIGIILMAIGGAVGSTTLLILGGILFFFGIFGLLTCLLVCLYAYFVYGTRDQEIQTDMTWTDDYLSETPGYASIGRPSALKSAESTLRRNGTSGQKKVTMAPEVGVTYGESPPNAVRGGNFPVSTQPQIKTSPDPRGASGRSVSGSDVGTGGIRITPLDRPFPSPGSQTGSVYGSGQGQAISGNSHFVYGGGQSVYSGGGSSVSSSIDATYAYPKSVSIISGPESVYSESAPGSQYSTLRSIPVTHVISEPQRQQQQQQQQESVEYARINKARNVHSTSMELPAAQRGYIVQGSGQSGQFQQRFPIEDDFDYDNPVEQTPMLPPKQSQSYHEMQMEYQRQQQVPKAQQDMYAPRTVNTYSLQRQQASNPYFYQQQQQQSHQEQQSQYQSNHSSSSSSRKVTHDDLPEPQPLVYPSARRPMTFEQVSSSKMSVYDNVLSGMKDSEEE